MFQEIKLLVKGGSFFSNKLAIELSHLIGFKSVAMKFPLAVFEGNLPEDTLCFVIEEGLGTGYNVETSGNVITVSIAATEASVRDAYKHLRDNFSALTHNFQEGSHGHDAPKDFRAVKNIPLEAFDSRCHKGLESLFDKDYILRDDNNDLLPDKVDAKILLDDGYSKHQVAAACNLAARLGMETTAISYPITTGDEDGGNLFMFRDETQCTLHFEGDEARQHFVFTGNGQALVDFSSAFCETFPLQKPGRRWLDVLNELADGLRMQTVDGQLACIDSQKDKINGNTKCYFSPKIHEVDEEVLKAYAPAQFLGYKDLKKVHEKEYDIPWEVDVCKEVLAEKLWPKVNAGDKVEIRAVLSECKESRDALAKELADMADARGANLVSAQVICAYKQGVSWLEDIVMPQLHSFGGVDKIEIFFKPFLAPGVTEWLDEDGAVPTYNNLNTDDEDKWFDLPIRYLQELYPVDDILSAGLGIARENIVFTEYKGEEDITYFATASCGEEVLWQGNYKATNQQRNYMDAYPGMGKVHPSTGWIWAAVNGHEVVSERIATDVERVWQIYQEEILPYCQQYTQQKTNGAPTIDAQPFFAQMRLDILLSEPDEKLHCREDLLSSLDTLHEDIYFAGLDFFKVYGNITTGEIFDAPGLILPVIKKRPGKPYFKFTLYDQYGLEPMIDFGQDFIVPTLQRKDISVTISKLLWLDGMLSPVISIKGPEGLGPVVQSYARLLSENKLALESRLANVNKLHFEFLQDGKAHTFVANVSEVPELPKDLSMEDIDIFENRMIGYDQNLEIISQLKRVPGISVYLSGETYLGRDIYAVEFLPSHQGYVSRTKRINQNPVLFINARHHANEPAATNAAYMLIKELLTKAEYEGLADKINLIIVPLENADGAAIHYELQKDNPNWILHIARFNAVGKEFYHEHFKEDTMHTEAKCLTKIWQEWLPDVIVDNHGVPSHEWAQQFSGYTSPSYKGFWLPRSLLYGCFWTVKEECYASNKVVAKKIEDIVADVIEADEKLKSLNKELQDRFAKYASRWMPRLFPAEYYRDMINVWIDFDYNPNHRYPSVRFPWITTVAYTSEIADETAQGDYLQLCAYTHMMHDIGIVKMMRDSKCVFVDIAEGASQEHRRQRPLIAD